MPDGECIQQVEVHYKFFLPLNKYVVLSKFDMEIVTSVLASIRKGDLMFSMDM